MNDLVVADLESEDSIIRSPGQLIVRASSLYSSLYLALRHICHFKNWIYGIKVGKCFGKVSPGLQHLKFLPW